MLIRDFVPSDAQKIVEILKANQQYGHPELDGPEAMLRVHQCPAAEFLVAEEDLQVVGFIRGVYDGSRAVIHIASVQPEYQRRGIGKALVLEIAKRFRNKGAASLMVTVPGEADFWRKINFRVTTRIMTAYPIELLIQRLEEETKRAVPARQKDEA